jgi:hypothetical protein
MRKPAGHEFHSDGKLLQLKHNEVYILNVKQIARKDIGALENRVMSECSDILMHHSRKMKQPSISEL